jgi:uncharacterized protein YsxB (DUF464 family)
VVDVAFHRDGRGRLSAIEARGHADFAIDADDLICAAVSAVLQAARLGLEVHAGTNLDARQHSGEFFIRWPENSRDDPRVDAIASTARLAVEQLARQYPEHVRCSFQPDERV